MQKNKYDEQLKQNNKKQQDILNKLGTTILTGDCEVTSISGLRVKQPP